MNSIGLYQRIRRLGSSVSLLHVGAHPDDEETGLLTYVVFKHHGRSVYWSATRGEGGQNMTNDYQGPALGVYRTWESLAAREMDGGQCLFGSFVDFGFSKSADEAFERWGRDRLTRELVQAIRLVQPRVVVSRWEGCPEDGHGHHQAVGRAVLDAFDLASDPGAFPGLIERGYPPWRPSRLYVSHSKTIYPSGQEDPACAGPGFARINTGEYSPLLNGTFQERAWRAYLRHRTQGIKVLPSPGDFHSYYRLLKPLDIGVGFEEDLFGGLEPGLAGLAGGVAGLPGRVGGLIEAVQEKVGASLACFDPGDPRTAATPLLEGLALLRSASDMSRDSDMDALSGAAMERAFRGKVAEFEVVIADCLGLRLESVCTRGRITPGESVWVRNRLWNFRRLDLDDVLFETLKPEAWRVCSGEGDAPTATGQGALLVQEMAAENDAALTGPYWLAGPGSPYVYGLDPEETTMQPFAAPPLSVRCTVTMGRDAITLIAPSLHRSAFGGGCRELPVALVPPISLHPENDRKFLLVRDHPQTLEIKVTARCNDEERPARGRLEAAGPQGWCVEPASLDVDLRPVDGAGTFGFQVRVPASAPEGRYRLEYRIDCRDRKYGVVLDPVRMGAPGLPRADDPSTCIREEFLLRPSEVLISIVDAAYKEGGRYGYIQGAAEQVVPILRSLGVQLRQLTGQEIGHGDLGGYEAIVVGPNAYLLRPDVRDNAHRLLDYVEAGGTLVVQYQGYGHDKTGLAPYPFKLNRPHDRVTDERAAVTMTRPHDPILRYPNRITEADFQGWVHDRGLYFFGEWDDRYFPLLSCADPGEAPKTGGLMKCDYGRGLYVYLGYSLFKQVAAGVPGAFRLFFNLLSAGQAKEGP
ncbi:MAG: PIG-L family deacetylase [Proteobacteria bacterium]|nr:PIG-L family deacetylase [Pseudomonadota bacterium]